MSSGSRCRIVGVGEVEYIGDKLPLNAQILQDPVGDPGGTKTRSVPKHNS